MKESEIDKVATVVAAGADGEEQAPNATRSPPDAQAMGDPIELESPDPESDERLKVLPDLAELLATVEELRAALAVSERQVAEIRQAHAESAAEFVKTRDRLRREAEAERGRVRAQMAAAFFGVADNMDRTLEASRAGGSFDALREGVVLVREQFFAQLSGFGVERYSPEGEAFDPGFHEAIGVVPVDDPEQDNTVMVVLQPGFRAGDQVLRAAMVQVGRLAQ